MAAAIVCAAPPAFGAAPQVRIAGNRFVDETGQPMRLLGFNAGVGLEYACVSPVFGPTYEATLSDGPIDAPAVAAMATWRAGAVRVTLNEDCWLGLNPLKRTARRATPVRPPARAAAGRALRRRYRAIVRAY
ncbi:MAG TPA: hypothetical protein VGN69_07655, partial [Solirubrobacteraceae bacterium]|nr:hypothetical protein [Solirubrobacteraceae bacterium]